MIQYKKLSKTKAKQIIKSIIGHSVDIQEANGIYYATSGSCRFEMLDVAEKGTVTDSFVIVCWMRVKEYELSYLETLETDTNIVVSKRVGAMYFDFDTLQPIYAGDITEE